MAVIFPLSLPAVDAHFSVTIRRQSSVGEGTSPFTFTSQVFVNQGKRWMADVNLPRMSRANKALWNSFLAKMNGKEGTVLLGDPSGSVPRGTASVTPGVPVVRGAGQTGQDLLIDGLPANQTGYLLKDDFIQLGTVLTSRLYQLLEDVNTNGSGQATLTLWPNVITAPVDNAPIVVSGAVGIFRMLTNESEFSNERNLVFDTPTLLFRGSP